MSYSLWWLQAVVKYKNGQEYMVTEVMGEHECFWNLKNLGLGYIRDFRPSFRDLLSTCE